MKRPLVWILIASVILIVVVLSALPLFIPSHYLEGLINRSIQGRLAYTSAFDRVRISFFPMPVIHIDNVKLTPHEGADLPLLSAERASFRPSLWSLLTGKPTLAYGSLKRSDVHYTLRQNGFVKIISLKDASVTLWNLASNQPVRFKVKGKFLSETENINISGKLKSNFEHFKVKDVSSKIQATIGPIELKRLTDWWGAPLPLSIKAGVVRLLLQVNKAEGSGHIEIKGNTDLEKFSYQIPDKPAESAPGDYQLAFFSDLDFGTGSLAVKQGSLTAPFGGPIELTGQMNLYNLFLREVVIKTKSLQLDTIPQYILSLERVMPVNLGFSGETQVDLYARGEPGLLQVNVGADLTNTNLAYSKYFSKISGVPLIFKSDMKLAAGRILRGDFTVSFEQASMKGSLVGLDLASGEGELTVLTNKFSIGGWQKHFPPLREFELSGDVKLLTNIKGNLNRPEEARIMNNFSLDSLQARAANGAEIKNLSGSLDSGPLDSEIKDLRFEIGDNSFFIDAKMFQKPDTKWLIGVYAPKIDVVDLTSQTRKIAEAVPSEQTINWTSIENGVQSLFSKEAIEPFEVQFAFGEKRFLMPQMKMGIFGGVVTGRGAYDISKEVPTSFVELDVQRFNLARMQGGTLNPIMYGNLFSYVQLTNEGPFDPEWLNRLTGRASVSVTNGELRTLDLLGSLGQIAQLAPLQSFRSGVTEFQDIRGDFDIQKQKIMTENTMLISEDLTVEAQGDVSFSGILNFHLSTYLSPALSQRIAPMIGDNKRLGPIPVLIVGPISQPQIRQDPMLITSFLQSLVQQHFSKITSRFIPSPATGSAQSDESALQNQPQSQESQNLDQQLLQSGLNLLESVLSKRDSSSNSSTS